MKDAHKSMTPKQAKQAIITQIAYLLQKRGAVLVATDSYGALGEYHGTRYSLHLAHNSTEIALDELYEALPANLVRSTG